MTRALKSLGTALAAIAFAGGALVGQAGPAAAAGEAAHPPERSWSWTGPFGSFDRAAAQRGLQVYVNVCASCHSLKHVYYRDLRQLGYSETQVKNFAATFSVTDGPDENGEMFERPAEPSDTFASPFPNKQAATAANGGAYPPDLSLIVKNRAHGFGSIGANFLAMLQIRGYSSGADYLSALLTGYQDPPPEGVELMAGQWYNDYMPGNAISMPPPLYPDAVEYEDGTEATPEQMAYDVSTFLAWAAEPRLEQRKETGIKVMLFLAFFTGLLIAVKRNIWSGVKKH